MIALIDILIHVNRNGIVCFLHANRSHLQDTIFNQGQGTEIRCYLIVIRMHTIPIDFKCIGNHIAIITNLRPIRIRNQSCIHIREAITGYDHFLALEATCYRVPESEAVAGGQRHMAFLNGNQTVVDFKIVAARHILSSAHHLVGGHCIGIDTRIQAITSLNLHFQRIPVTKDIFGVCRDGHRIAIPNLQRILGGIQSLSIVLLRIAVRRNDIFLRIISHGKIVQRDGTVV